VVDDIPGGNSQTGAAPGILGPIAGVTGSLEAAEALKMLVAPDRVRTEIIYFDSLSYTFETIKIRRRESCPACGKRRFDFLEGRVRRQSFVAPEGTTTHIRLPGALDLLALRERLAGTTEMEAQGKALRVVTDDAEFVLLADGAVIVRGVGDRKRAEALLDALLES
jgi:hypothetical protein